jgi:hypothetical protein
MYQAVHWLFAVTGVVLLALSPIEAWFEAASQPGNTHVTLHRSHRPATVAHLRAQQPPVRNAEQIRGIPERSAETDRL